MMSGNNDKRSREIVAPGYIFGFTLVEVVVAMAVLAILAGVMMPAVYRLWESNEINETRERMADLKRAMVGDAALIQNGIRMHYGFVGDNGALPASLADLISDSGGFANWDGPYLAAGYDPSSYNRDAWGNGIIYTVHSPPLAAGGQLIAATLRSPGADGISGTGDDRNENTDPELQIYEREVWPTGVLQGNLHYVFSSAATVTPDYSADLAVEYNGPAGTQSLVTDCMNPLGIGQVEADQPKAISVGFVADPGLSLPVGRILVTGRLYEDASCAGLVEQSATVAVYVGNGVNSIPLNLPAIHYTIP